MMKWPAHLLIVLVTIFTAFQFPQETQSARILSVSFISSKSHKIIYEPLLYALAERGHQVTILGPICMGKNTTNLTQIPTYDPATLKSRDGGPLLNIGFEDRQSTTLLDEVVSNPFLSFFRYMEAGCHASYDLDVVQRLVDQKFDAIIFPPLWNDCMYGLIHRLNTTTILISQMALMPWVASTLGTPTFPSFTPLLYYGQPATMNYFERTLNFLGILYFHAVLKFSYNPRMEALYRDRLGDANLPGIEEIQSNASLVLVNSHISFIPPRPILPDVVEVGGMHLRPAKPVPKDLDEFVTGSGKDGFIVFSMGSFLQTSTMPENCRQIFLKVFSQLKQRVIWKWETETMPDLPSNVKLSKWLPQQDVLGHKNVRLFVTHGGHGSTTEALYEGVPLVGIPMFGDQQSNMKQAVDLGFALSLRFDQLTEENLLEAIRKVLDEPKYAERARELSRIMKDQVDNPLDRAVFWTEYVIRHRGATHLRSPARNLNFFQYYSLDVILGLSAFVATVGILVTIMVKTILRKLVGLTTTAVPTNKKSGAKTSTKGKKTQ